MKIYHNTMSDASATIERIFLHPYKGAKKEASYAVTMYSGADDNFYPYFRAVYETREEAIYRLNACCFNVAEKAAR
jgi:hypothetical protein